LDNVHAGLLCPGHLGLALKSKSRLEAENAARRRSDAPFLFNREGEANLP
jgi:hypothetical protein